MTYSHLDSRPKIVPIWLFSKIHHFVVSILVVCSHTKVIFTKIRSSSLMIKKYKKIYDEVHFTYITGYIHINLHFPQRSQITHFLKFVTDLLIYISDTF